MILFPQSFPAPAEELFPGLGFQWIQAFLKQKSDLLQKPLFFLRVSEGPAPAATHRDLGFISGPGPPSLFFVFYKREIDPLQISLVVLAVIPHVGAMFRHRAGPGNVSRTAGSPFQIQAHALLPVEIQFFFDHFPVFVFHIIPYAGT